MFSCDFCDKNFATKSNLTRHTKTSKTCSVIKGEGVALEFSCDLCNKLFPLKFQLESHVKSCIKRNNAKNYDSLYEEHEKLKSQLKEQEVFYKEELRLQSESYETQIRKLNRTYNKELKAIILENERKEEKQQFQIKTFIEAHDKMENEFEKLKLEHSQVLKEKAIIEAEIFVLKGKKNKIYNVTGDPPKFSVNLSHVDTNNVVAYSRKYMYGKIKEKYNGDIFRRGITGITSFVVDLLTNRVGETMSRMYARSDPSRSCSVHLLKQKNPDMWEKDDKFGVLHYMLNTIRDLTDISFMFPPRNGLQVDLSHGLELNELFYALAGTPDLREKLIKNIMKKIC